MNIVSTWPGFYLRNIVVSSLTLLSVACGDSDTPLAENSDIPIGNDQSDSTNPVVHDDSTNDTASQLISAFENFLDENNVEAGAIAVNYNDEPVSSGGVNRQATTVAPVASLSKAITGVCTLNAMDEYAIAPTATIGSLLPELFSTYDIADAGMQQITLEQLVTHNSGIHTAHVSELGATIPTMRLEEKEWQFEYIAGAGLEVEPGSGFHYANANYLILGLVVEKLTGEDYETWCNGNVLKPLSITTARLSPEWTFLSSFGGWEISAADYIRFADNYFSPTQLLDENPDNFDIKIELGGGTYYGPGIVMRSSPEGYHYWHNGSFTWRSIEQSGNFGSYFAVYANGFTVAVNLDADLLEGRGEALDELLYRAAHNL